MKPTRNRYYCKAGGRIKMLFGTEEEALSFIRHNADDVRRGSGYAPVRAYHCSICMGWHLTSDPDARKYDGYRSAAEDVLERYRAEMELSSAPGPAVSRYRRDGAGLVASGHLLEAAGIFLKGFHNLSATQPDEATILRDRAVETTLAGLEGLLARRTFPYSELRPYQTLYWNLRKLSVPGAGTFEETLARISGRLEAAAEKATMVYPADYLEKRLGNISWKDRKRLLERRDASAHSAMGRVKGGLAQLQEHMASCRYAEARDLFTCIMRDLDAAAVRPDSHRQLKPMAEELVEVASRLAEAFPESVYDAFEVRLGKVLSVVDGKSPVESLDLYISNSCPGNIFVKEKRGERGLFEIDRSIDHVEAAVRIGHPHIVPSYIEKSKDLIKEYAENIHVRRYLAPSLERLIEVIRIFNEKYRSEPQEQ